MKNSFVVLPSLVALFMLTRISSFKAPDPVHLIKNREHLKEHLQESLGIDGKAADLWLKENNEHMQFFLVHDYDQNSKLDGLELLKSIVHHEHQQESGGEEADKLHEDPEQYATFIDTLIDDQDTNKDGYIDYLEYMAFIKKQQDSSEQHEEQNTQH